MSLPLAIPTDLFNFIPATHGSPNWADWHGWWLSTVFSRHFVVLWFIPLLPALLLTRGQALKRAILITGVIFIAYVFGLAYVALWLAIGYGLYRLGERFAIECRRTDVLPIGPPLAAGTIIVVGYLIIMAAHDFALPPATNAWLYAHCRWFYPLGTRGYSWEPAFNHLLPIDGSAPHWFFTLFWDPHFIGAAYLAARMLPYFAEIKRGGIPAERRTLLNFFAYICYAPALIQGPIERFNTFHDEIETCHERRSWANVPPAFWRIGLGIFKAIVAAAYFRPLLWYDLHIGNGNDFWLHPENIQSFWLLYFGVFFIIFTLYLEFSGYCDIAVGFARLFGYRQAENFNMPWVATSMRDLWRRWHLTLSFILRDYVYIPLGGNRRHVTFNLCMTFFLCGIWHRIVLQVALWGLLMGFMVAVNQHWVGWVKKLDADPTRPFGRIRQAWLRCGPLPTICAWIVTQHAFMFTLLLFFGGAGIYTVPREIIRRLVLLFT